MDDKTQKEASKTMQIKALELMIVKLTCRFEDFIKRNEKCWVIHDDRSVEKWGGTKENLGKLDKNLDGLSKKMYSLELLIVSKMGMLDCKEHKHEFVWHKVFIGGAYASVLLLLTAIAKGWIG